jgi:hypothetical protein
MAQLLSNLPIGAKVKFGKYSVNGETAEPIIWLVVAKNHVSTPAYPTNSVTLLTEKVIDIRALDAKEPNSSDPHRPTGGNNNYGLSNMDQWLNKDNVGGAWYVARHSTDQAPTDDSVVLGATPYANRPGFLNAFTASEKNAIKDTIIRVAKPDVDGAGFEDISRKVFLPSATEVGVSTDGGITEGARWSYFNGRGLVTALTSQAITNSPSTHVPTVPPSSWSWWLRTPLPRYSTNTYCVTNDGTSSVLNVHYGSIGIRPALNLSSTITTSDTTDSDGCYTLTPNTAPSAPSSLAVPSAIYGGKANQISWASAIDTDGDAITYHLECSINAGGYTEIYSGALATYAHLVPFGTTSVAYRVRATDPSGVSSAYTSYPLVPVTNNNAPVISGSDANLGVKSAGFTGTYTVTDANSDAVTVTESIDGVQIRALVATLGQSITYGVTGNTWLALPNGSHTLTIRATDGIDSTVRTYTFTKLVEEFTIINSTPMATSTMPTRIMLVVTRNIPSTASFSVEVCNNGFDVSPTWEFCTDAVKSGLVHVFSNTKKTASNWGVLVRVRVSRNGATGACYVSAIGGNFE